MKPSRAVTVLPAVVLLLAACAESPPSSRAAASKSAASAVTPAAMVFRSCFPPSGGIQLRADSIAGFSTRSTFAELQRLCPAARVDTIGVGGTPALALRFDFPGAVVWAVSTDEDSLHGGMVPDFWAATGDSLRFSSNEPIPQNVGAIRSLDSAGVVVVDHVDDTSGSFIVLCRFPAVELVVGNLWPSFADEGVAPLSRASVNDTTRLWRVEVNPRGADARVERACKLQRPA